MASRLNRPGSVTKRDLTIGIVLVLFLVAATIVSIWLLSRRSSDEKALAHVVHLSEARLGGEAEHQNFY